MNAFLCCKRLHGALKIKYESQYPLPFCATLTPENPLEYARDKNITFARRNLHVFIYGSNASGHLQRGFIGA